MYILLIEISFLQNLMNLQVKPTGQMGGVRTHCEYPVIKTCFFFLFLFVVSLSYFILAYSKHLLHYFCHQVLERKLKQTGLWREMQWKMFFYLNCTLYWCPYFEAGDPDSFPFNFPFKWLLLLKFIAKSIMWQLKWPQKQLG